MASKKTTTKTDAKANTSKKAAEETPDDWFSTGEQGMAKKRAQDALGAAKKERGVARFFMKEGESGLITFVGSDSGFYIN